MKLKKNVPFLLYLLGVLPFVYTLINVQCINKNYIEFKNLALNWAVDYDNLRHYMNSEIYICMFIIALLITILFLKSNKLYQQLLAYLLMFITNVSFVNKLTETDVYVNELSSRVKNPICLKSMNIIYETEKEYFSIVNVYVYVGCAVAATALLMFIICRSYQKNTV